MDDNNVKQIGDFPSATDITDDDVLLAEQAGKTRKLSGKVLKDFCRAAISVFTTRAETAATAAEAAKNAAAEIEQLIGEKAGVASFNGRAGIVVPQSGDYTAAMTGAADQAEVFSNKVPNFTVELTAEELPAYVGSLPRFLTKNYIIKVSGETESELVVTGFHGSGSIDIRGEATLGKVMVDNCSAFVKFQNIVFHEPAAGLGPGAAIFSAENASLVYLQNCGIAGQYKTLPEAAAAYGLSVYRGNLSTKNISIQGCNHAVIAGYGATVSVRAEAASNISDNNNGAYVYNGGIVLLSGSAPDTLGGASNAKSGGIIAKANGTLL